MDIGGGGNPNRPKSQKIQAKALVSVLLLLLLLCYMCSLGAFSSVSPSDSSLPHVCLPRRISNRIRASLTSANQRQPADRLMGKKNRGT